MMRLDSTRLHHADRLHAMTCRCRRCRIPATTALLRRLRAVAAAQTRAARHICSTPFYDPAQRRFTLLSRETVAVPLLITPALIAAIALFLALQP